MMRDIHRRIEKLEAEVPQQPPWELKAARAYVEFITLTTAFYLGDPDDEGSVMDAYARALGYQPGSLEFRKALTGRDADFRERVRLAEIKLFEKFGVNSKAEPKIAIEAMRRMKAGLSGSYMDVLRYSERKKGAS